MREIRELKSSDVAAYADIAFNAYPSFKDFSISALDDYRASVTDILENDPIVTFLGLFQEDTLIGVMRLFDFEMNLFGKILPVSGVGFLGVHLMHKKKGVARTLITYYEEHYLKKQMPLAMLLPFRPDFYKSMGYGFGTKMNQYRIPNKYIPNYKISGRMDYLTEASLDDILQCHDLMVRNSHGRLRKFSDEINDLFGDPFNRVVGHYNDEGVLDGYIVYKFQNGKAGNYTINHMYVKEMIYHNPKVLESLMGYFKTQTDQVELFIFNTENEGFHFMFANPLNDTKNYIPYGYLETNTQAVGVMYKLLDVAMAFKQCEHRNYNNYTGRVKIITQDDYSTDSTATIVHFKDGKASIVYSDSNFDYTIKIKGSDFASLFIGSINVLELYHNGLLIIDDPMMIKALDLAFYCPEKPVCYTDF